MDEWFWDDEVPDDGWPHIEAVNLELFVGKVVVSDNAAFVVSVSDQVAP